MDQSLFVYGTLMIPEIQEALLQKKVKSKDAVLEDFSANCLIYGHYSTEYPFLKATKGNKLKGKILYSLTGHDLNLIKFYEGSEYTLSEVKVIAENGILDVNTFMLKKSDKIEYGPEWQYDIFVRDYIDDYTNRIIPELLVNYNM